MAQAAIPEGSREVVGRKLEDKIMKIASFFQRAARALISTLPKPVKRQGAGATQVLHMGKLRH